MAGTFSQAYVHIVFAVKGKQSLISRHWEEKLYKYITGIVQHSGQKMLAINGMPDHIHFLFGMKPNCRVSDLVREVKKSSNQYIKSHQFVIGKFEWQTGYGMFTHQHSSYSNVITYIMNQKQHHAEKTFKQEYIQLLNQFGIAYDEKYLFEFISY